MAEVRESESWKLVVFFWRPWEEGEEEVLREGVAMSMGEVDGMVARRGGSQPGVGGLEEDTDEGGEEASKGEAEGRRSKEGGEEEEEEKGDEEVELRPEACK
jgi:hypothetical protein